MKRIFFLALMLLLLAVPSFAAFSNASLNGSYVFAYNGYNTTGGYTVAGTFQADGNGKITAGVLDQNGAGKTVSTQVSITGTYTVDSNGRGRMTLTSSLGSLAFAFAMVSNDLAKFIVYDANATGRGEFERRTFTSVDNSSLKGSYVYLLEGGAVAWTSVVGRFTADGAGAISAGNEDINNSAVLSQNVTFTGTYSVASNGRGTATFSATSGPKSLAFYPVSPNKVKFVSLDVQAGVFGDAELQDAVNFSNNSLSGGYAFLERGVDSSGWVAMAGRFTADGNGGLNSGIADSNAGGSPGWGTTFTGTYTVGANGRTIVSFVSQYGTSNMVFYLVSANKYKYVLLSTREASGGFGEAQQGLPFSASLLQGKYAYATVGSMVYRGGWYDLVADGSLNGDGNGNVTGDEDSNWAGSMTPAAAFTGSFSTDMDGRALLTTYGRFAAYAVSPARLLYVYMGTDGVLSATADRLGPYVPPNGSVNGASFAGGGLPPGGIVSIFGVNFTSAVAVGPSPLPTTLNGVSVTLNGIQAPLFFVSPGQINIQVPWQLAGQTQATLIVTNPDFSSPPQSVPIVATSAGIFIITGDGHGAVLNANTFELAAPAGLVPGLAAKPISRGQYLAIYCTGLGVVDPQPANGAPPVALATAAVKPTVDFNGVQQAATWAGLAPGYVGLYQVNVQVPANATTGDAVPIKLIVNGVASNTATIAIQ